jgi:hypothetical protein
MKKRAPQSQAQALALLMYQRAIHDKNVELITGSGTGMSTMALTVHPRFEICKNCNHKAIWRYANKTQGVRQYHDNHGHAALRCKEQDCICDDPVVIEVDHMITQAPKLEKEECARIITSAKKLPLNEHGLYTEDIKNELDRHYWGYCKDGKKEVMLLKFG